MAVMPFKTHCTVALYPAFTLKGGEEGGGGEVEHQGRDRHGGRPAPVQRRVFQSVQGSSFGS